jgi:hypothetical protein
MTINVIAPSTSQSITNTATISTPAIDGNAANNTASVLTTVFKLFP